MASEIFNPDTIINQEEIFGRGATFRDPLLPGLSSERERLLAAAYCSWLAQSGFADKIVFLDITFAPTGAQAVTTEVDTLILSPTEQVANAYEVILKNFIAKGKSIAALPFFRSGLSIDSDSESPREGFLLWAANRVETPNPVAETANQPLTFYGKITPTYASAQEVARSQSAPGPEAISLTERWSEYVRILRASPELRSHSTGKPEDDGLGIVGAAPLGVRHPQSPKRFNSVADVFFGLNRRCSRDTALSFLRFLFLQLLRNNVAVRSSEMTQGKIIAAIGHEVRRVTDMMGDLWAPPATALFHVSVGGDVNSAALPAAEYKLGRIDLDAKYGFLLEDLHVAPFGDLLGAARRTIDLWAFSSSEENLPTKPPANWSELTQFAWRSALDQVIMYFLSSNGAYSASSVEERREEMVQLRHAYRLQAPEVAVEASAEPSQVGWTYENDALRRQLAGILRVLTAWFANCVEHGSLQTPINVLIGCAKDSPLRLRLTINNRERTPDERLPDFTNSQEPEALIPGGPHTRDSIQLALFILRGELETIARNEDTSTWLLRCAFDWRLHDGG